MLEIMKHITKKDILKFSVFSMGFIAEIYFIFVVLVTI